MTDTHAQSLRTIEPPSKERLAEIRAHLAAGYWDRGTAQLLAEIDRLRGVETKLRKDHRDAYLAVMEERDNARNQLRTQAAEHGKTFQFRVCQSPRGVVVGWTDVVDGYVEFVGDAHAGRPRLEFRTVAQAEGRPDA